MNITSKQKTGNECISYGGMPTGFQLLDFWRWNASELLDNTLRGTYCEFIVSAALGLDMRTTRENWTPWDITFPYIWECDGVRRSDIRVEVKSSAYIQPYEQSKLSKIIFTIRPTLAWAADTGYDHDAKRQSDVYVFGLYAEKDKSKADPLNLDGWEFYVLPTKKLDEMCGTQQTISLGSLEKLNPIKTAYTGIKDAVIACV